MGSQATGVSPEALKLLEEHSWPGNVRELGNAMIRASVLSPGRVLFPKDFSLSIGQKAVPADYDNLSLEEIIQSKLEDYFQRTRGVHLENLYSLIIERVERPLIELTLKATHGNQIRAAKILGINRNTLRKKITYLHIKMMENYD